ncbi:MAG: beta-ketoacyl synthase chain length factor [Flavitalea sp.]
MFYIHQTTCISPQHTFSDDNAEQVVQTDNNRFYAIEPSSSEIPDRVLRRMGKAVRLGVNSGMSLIKSTKPTDGIIIGTANGGMEDCIRFLNQIIEYEEGMLTPTNFVQSTANAVAGQVGMMLKNKGYNITHVHRGHSFEHAMLDAAMQLRENKEHTYLLGAVDEISDYDFNIDFLDGWFKTGTGSEGMYETDSPGTIAGEGAAMFIANNQKNPGAIKIEAINTITTTDHDALKDHIARFIDDYDLEIKPPQLLITGENGDSRMKDYYLNAELAFPETTIARFKHRTGDYATACAQALWYACKILRSQTIPADMIKNDRNVASISRCLIYNEYKTRQHSLILCSIEV